MATLSKHTEFTPERSQLSHDIARNDTAEEDDPYKDLDPAILLQSLADFEHPAFHSQPRTVSPPNVPPSAASEPPAAPNYHFEGLLQAVAAANGEQAAHASPGQKQTNAIAPKPVNSLSNIPKTTSTKRKRSIHDDDDGETFGFLKPTKALKKQKQKQAEEQLALEREIWGPQSAGEDDENGEPRSPIKGNAARAAGVHSAAALFRAPTAASKKYTRSPMASVFAQLELNTDLFLQLQAAAKKFMLDPDYPERAECVGNRSKGDADMTKLKLFGCVESFLEDGGWGEKCWGKSAPPLESKAPRRLRWPELRSQVITSVTPLMRRMVTNERQRIYALQFRHTKKAKGAESSEREISQTPTEGKTPTPRPLGERMRAVSPSLAPSIDPKLNHYNVGESPMAQHRSMSQSQANSMDRGNGEPSPEPADGSLKYTINIMQNGRRTKPKVSLTAVSLPDYSSLVQQTLRIIGDETLKFINIRVLGPGSWLDVGNEDEWKRAIAVVEKNDILEREVKCVVQIGEDELQ